MKIHALKGKKQTKEHIAKRVASYKSHPRKLRDLGKRLMSKVKIDKKGCWGWQGARFRKEYGDYAQIRIGRKNNSKCVKAHRVSYEHFVGKVLKGLELDHLCHNTLCINPEHLQPVTHSINMSRRKDSGLLNCKYGHLYSKKTTYIRSDNGRRECMVCRKVRRT